MAEVVAGAGSKVAAAATGVKALGAKVIAAGAAGTAFGVAKTGFEYNRVAFNYDQTLRWQRFTTGRKFAQEQTEMFRQDVEDLANVAKNKLKTYGPIMTMSIGYCVTVLVEGRSGLKFPAPPTFLSGLYLQCLGVAFSYFTLSIWLVFHAALRAQIACVQLRTRKVRLPVPSQSQLDNARRLASSYEEQDLYDIFKLPYVAPQRGGVDEAEEEGAPDTKQGKKPAKGGKELTKASKGASSKAASSSSSTDDRSTANHFPGFKDGVPMWIDREHKDREDLPGFAPDTELTDGPPYAHFEMIRNVQKEWWSAEAYNRINMLYGMIHFIQAFAYWFVIHCMTDLALFWTGVAGSTGLTAAVWLIFRMDVLPDKGGCAPIEFAGPFVASIATGLSYIHSPTQLTQDSSRAIAAICFIMHILQLMRMYVLAKPSNSAVDGVAREAGGRIFNSSASCEAPSWLPQSFQVVTYLIAPPASDEQKKKDLQQNDAIAAGELKGGGEYEVDMRPWYYTRALTLVCMLGWLILLTGQVVESVMGERMLMTNPGTPPWTRRPLWYGWEFGPITSKHYAHVTPQRGHYSWQVGWGPQGQQELWPSDLFGFHPEADMWWSEPADSEPGWGGEGAWGHGENKWLDERLKYGLHGELHAGQPGHAATDHSSHTHDALPQTPLVSKEGAGGGHAAAGGHHDRRLRGDEPKTTRVLVPAAVQWPALLEPELLVCGPKGALGSIAALTRNGFGAILPEAAAAGLASGLASNFSLNGLPAIGMARGISWTSAALMVVTNSGKIARCPTPVNSTVGSCRPLSVPNLPASELPAIILDAVDGAPLRAAVASSSGTVALLELSTLDSMEQEWLEVAQVRLPSAATDSDPPEVVSVSSTPRRLYVAAADGMVHHWALKDGRPASGGTRDVPNAGANRVWRSACALPDGQILRLASTWRKAAGDDLVFHPELLL